MNGRHLVCVCVCVCQLREGYVLTSVQRGEDSTVSRVDDVTVSDGQWHHLLLEVRGPSPGGTMAALSLDYGLYTVRHDLSLTYYYIHYFIV